MNEVSTTVDPYIAVYYDSNPCWTITLEDGRNIYQDDDRPGLSPSAWKRAKKAIYANDLEIDIVRFRFSGYEHIVYDRKRDDTYQGFYFSKGKAAILSQEESREFDTYVAGKVYGDMVSVKKYDVPFERIFEELERPVHEKNYPSIILDREYRKDV